MDKKIYLSIVCALAIGANAADLGTIDVTGVTDTKIISNVSNEDVKSADLAEALYKEVPSINLIRRSGIANDITLRGQKRDNIVVTMDDSKVCGACPNRMDPPTSHIVTANINSVKVSEGPYDVEEFGNLSGSVKVTMKKPTKKLKGSVESTIGSFGYRKVGASVSGGNDKVRLLLTGSYENSEQYKDGSGNTVSKQIDKAVTGTKFAGYKFQDRYKDMDAYTKKTAMAKVYVDVNDKQDMQLSYTANRSDDVLYGNSKMDAIYDNSDIINFKYTIRDLNKYSKKLTFKAYNSQVTHPMSTKYRIASDDTTNTTEDSNNEVVSKLTTDMTGVKVINDLQINSDLFTLGLDTNRRNWDGEYIGYGAKAGLTGLASIDDVDTINGALFMKYDKNIDKLNLKFGVRFNDTTIITANNTYEDREFSAVDANMLATYNINDTTKYFAGIGRASRVPDGRELYFNSSMNVMSGTPTLDQTTNTEIDLGFERKNENGYFKLKAYYSKLNDYIYFNKDNIKIINKKGTIYKTAYNAFENIDAKTYGLELLGSYDISDDSSLDFGASYQRGKKDKPMTGTIVDTTNNTTKTVQQTNTNLADITPLKINVALNYDIDDSLSTKVELVHVNSWNKYDDDNGEQYLQGYNIINIKAKKEFNKKFEATVGVDNLFDKTYAISNTYADLILLSDGTSGEVMLLNEPGRYIYANIKYKF